MPSTLPSPPRPSSSSSSSSHSTRSSSARFSISTSRENHRRSWLSSSSSTASSSSVIIVTSPRASRSPRTSSSSRSNDDISIRRRSAPPSHKPSLTERVLAHHVDKPSPSMTSPLAMRLEIKLEKGGDVLDMFGGARTGTSYSLPGHVVVTVPAGEAGEGMSLRILKTLEIAFEGKSEFFDEQGRYTPLRLIAISKSILAGPARLSSHRTKMGVLTYCHPFDLVIPGWLPPSHVSSMTHTSYGLVAKGTIGWDAVPAVAVEGLDRSRSPSPAPASSSATTSFTYRQRFTRSLASALHPSASHSHPEAINTAMSCWKPVRIARHRLPSSAEQPNGAPDAEPGSERSFALNADIGSPSPVECHVTVPQWVDATPGDKSLKVSIRIRARPGYAVELAGMEAAPGAGSSPSLSSSSSTGSLPRSSCSTTLAAKAAAAATEVVPTVNDNIHMVELGMEVEETERFTSIPAQTFTSMYPIPKEQPSASNSSIGPHAFLSPRTQLAEIALLGLNPPATPYRAMRTKPLLLADDGQPRNFQFAGDGLELCEKWRKVNVVLPMNISDEAIGNDLPQPEFEGPFLRVRHKLKVRVVCRSTSLPGSDTVVILSTPLRFGTAPERPRGTISIDGKRVPMVALPAYTQLYHENGEQRDGEPLPLYEPSAPLEEPPSFEASTLPHPASVTRETLELSRTSTPLPTPDEVDPMDIDGSGSEDGDASGSSAGDVSSDTLASDSDAMDVCPTQPPTPRTLGGRKASASPSSHHTAFVAGLAL